LTHKHFQFVMQKRIT